MEKYLKKYPYLGASFMEPFKKSPKKLTGLAKMIGKLKEKLCPNLDNEESDEIKKSLETVKEHLNEIKTTVETVQSLIENTQDRFNRRTSKFIK